MQCMSRQNVQDISGHSYSTRWLPRSLQRPYLLFLAAIFLLVAIAVEILRQYSTRHNGIVQYQRKEELSSQTWQVWANTPTIIGLFLMVLWEVFAQDALRLEPYFQLADGRGALADVLFMNYNFGASLLAPIRAARNRHWIVFCVSLVSLPIHALVPSLLSGLFILQPQSALEARLIDSWPNLVSLNAQENWFSIQAAHRAMSQHSSTNNHGQKNGSGYAIPPASFTYDSNEASSSTLNQSVYWSDMTCTNSTLTGTIPSSAIFNATADGGHWLSWNLSGITIPGVELATACNISLGLDALVPRDDEGSQVRYWEPIQAESTPSFQSAFISSNCTSAELLGVMIDLDALTGIFLGSNVTIFACQSRYRHGIANITFTFGSALPEIEVTPSTIRDLSRDDFSKNGFRSMISADHLKAPLAENGTITSSSSQMGQSPVIAADARNLHLTQYQEMIGRLWNDEFIDAVNTLFDRQAGASPVSVELLRYSVSIMVVFRAAVIVEVIMISGFGLVIGLSCIYPHRLSVLCEEPSSIAAQCRLIARLISQETLHVLSHPNYHVAKTRDLRKWAKRHWCRWTQKESGGSHIDLFTMDGTHVKMSSPPAVPTRPDPMPHFLVFPWFMAEFLLLVGAVTAFGLSYEWIQVRVMESFIFTRLEIAAVFLMYGPTMLVSAICSLFNSIHRNISAAEPWIRLRNGGLRPGQLSTPIYGPIPTLLNSMRSGSRANTTLLALSLLCVMNLILVVVSGGVFEPQLNTYIVNSDLTTSYNDSTTIGQAMEPVFSNYDRSVYALTDRVSLPWTTSDFSFFPFDIDMPDYAIGVLYTATTRGVGTYLTCDEIPSTDMVTDHDTGTVNCVYIPLNDQSLQCNVQLPLALAENQQQRIPTIQYAWPDGLKCQRLSFVVSATLPAANQTTTPPLTFHCTPHLTIQSFEIQTTPGGHIKRYTPIPYINNDTDPTKDKLLQQNLTTTFLQPFNQDLGSFIHNLTTHPQPLPPYLSSFPNNQTAELYKQSNPKTTSKPISIETLTHSIQTIYQKTLTNYLTLYRDDLFPKTPPGLIPVPGKTTYTMWGFMPSNTAILLIMVLLLVDALALGAVFLWYRGRYDGPRIPKAVGSLVPWVSGREMGLDLDLDLDLDLGSGDDGGDGVKDRKGRRIVRFWCEIDVDGERRWKLGVREGEGDEDRDGGAVREEDGQRSLRLELLDGR